MIINLYVLYWTSGYLACRLSCDLAVYNCTSMYYYVISATRYSKFHFHAKVCVAFVLSTVAIAHQPHIIMQDTIFK